MQDTLTKTTSKDLILRQEYLVENPTTRVPICLCMDCSPSMSGDPNLGAPPNVNGVPIEELNEGIKHFMKAIIEDEIAKYSAEISLVSFSGRAECMMDFNNPEYIIDTYGYPRIELDLQLGGTSIGSGVELAIEKLEERKLEYQHAGVDYYQPWLILMTDGYPTDQKHIEAAKRISKMVTDKKLTIFPIGIGDGADLNVLASFSPKRPPVRLKGLRFQEFFEWLSQSISQVSNSNPGESITLPSISGWAETEV